MAALVVLDPISLTPLASLLHHSEGLRMQVEDAADRNGTIEGVVVAIRPMSETETPFDPGVVHEGGMKETALLIRVIMTVETIDVTSIVAMKNGFIEDPGRMNENMSVVILHQGLICG